MFLLVLAVVMLLVTSDRLVVRQLKRHHQHDLYVHDRVHAGAVYLRQEQQILWL